MTDTPANVINLSKPVQAHGHETTVLELREPTGEDVMVCGLPVTLPAKQGDKPGVDMATVGAYVSRLGNIPMSSVKTLSAADMMAATKVVMGFFGGALQS